MNEEQYSRANKRVLLAIVVVFGYIAATLMLALGVSQGGHAAKIVMEQSRRQQLSLSRL